MTNIKVRKVSIYITILFWFNLILISLVEKIGRWPQHHWSYFRFARHLIIGAQSLYYTYTALQSYNLELKVWFSTWKPIFSIPTRVCTLCCIFLRRCIFWLEIMVCNLEIWVPTISTHNLSLILMGMKQKLKIGEFKKITFYEFTNFQLKSSKVQKFKNLNFYFFSSP